MPLNYNISQQPSLNPKRSWKDSALKVIPIAVIVVAGFFLVNNNLNAQEERRQILRAYVNPKKVSPDEKYLKSQIKFFNPEIEWDPQKEVNTSLQPEINGASGIIVDINSGEILFEKESEKKRPIASIVKIMTAVVAVEHSTMEKEIMISPEAAAIGENSMGLFEGEIYSLEELLYGLFLHSGNDAAYAISEGVAGDTKTFVNWMNIKAKELGLEDTYFADPSGLDNRSYSTPKDLVKLTRYALKHPEIKQVSQTVEYSILENKNHRGQPLYNQTNLLTTYPGVKGFKTGFTEPAGLCLVTYAENEGVEVVGVVLNSQDRKGDMVLMLDHGFSSKGVFVLHDLL